LRFTQETAEEARGLNNPHSSLAVFYVEQVALNRHVLFFLIEGEAKRGCIGVNNFFGDNHFR